MTMFSTSLRAIAATVVLAACQPAAREAPAEPAIWRIADADSEIWLFGTVHVLPASLNWRGPRFDAAFAAAEELVTETDTESAAETYTPLVQRYGALPAGRTLADEIEPALWAQFQNVARSMNIDPFALQTSRPWFAAVTLSVIYAQQQGHVAEAGVENVLVPEARRAGKRLSYLETPEQQIRALADLPQADQVRFLAVTLEQIEQAPETLDETDTLWARGDVEALGELLDAQLQEAGPAVYEAVISGRNRAWVDAIQERLTGSGRTFYAVGAAHLAGRDSVVAMLRARGVEVEGP